MSEHRQEEEYFDRIDREKMDKLRAQLSAEAAVTALRERQEIHWMHCGKCGTKMETKAFRGCDIDVCPQCGAVLLDAGELEKLAGKDHTGLLDGIIALFGG